MSPHAVDDDDRALVRRCLEGDEDAWRVIVHRQRAALIGLAGRIVPRQVAEDVVDAVIADVWHRRKLERYEQRSALGTWLGAIVINAALNARRSARARSKIRTIAGDAENREPSVNAPDGGSEQQLASILNEAIAALPPPLKVLMLMYYEQGLTLEEAGVLLGVSKSTLSRNLRQAREQIRTEADRLARAHLGMTLDALRGDADLNRLEFDLRAACAARDEGVRGGSNS